MIKKQKNQEINIKDFLIGCINNHTTQLVSIFFLETLIALFSPLTPLVLSNIFKSVSDNPNIILQSKWIYLFFTLIIADTILGRLSNFMQLKFRPKIRQSGINILFTVAHQQTQRFFTENMAGSLAHSIVEASQSAGQLIFTLINQVWTSFLIFAISLIILSYVNLGLSIFFFAWIIIFLSHAYWSSVASRPFWRAAVAQKSKVVGTLVDSLTNQLSVKLFDMQNNEFERLKLLQKQEYEHLIKANINIERNRYFQLFFLAFLKIGVLLYSIFLLKNGSISTSQLIITIGLSMMIVNQSKNLGQKFQDILESINNINKSIEIVFDQYQPTENSPNEEFKITQGDIEFRNVNFGFNKNILLFENMNVLINAGEKVGLVGTSGSGKSTFINLILGLYEPNEGEIIIDDVNLSRLSKTSIRSQISLIPQDLTLFHRTLFENISYAKPSASKKEVIAAAKKAHADEFISKLKDGYSTMVGERGIKLSGGQRQRIAIARAILQDSSILLLDEATSSLDTITENFIQTALKSFMENKTVIVVAHRLSTITNLDRILVFDNGKIVEDGTHSDLLQKKGHYLRLWKAQVSGCIPDNL